MSKAIRSMTGYAQARTSTPDGEVTVSLRAVNHRSLDLHFHMPPELDAFEAAIRKAMQSKVGRGHVDVRISVSRVSTGSAPRWNRALLDAWLRAFREAAAEHGIDAKPDLNAALRMPGMLVSDDAPDFSADFEAGLMAAVNRALDAMNEYREGEGKALAAILLKHVANIAAAAGEIAAAREGVLPALTARLQERLAELLKGSPIEPQRIAQEAALLSDRSDIAEEITRLRLHAESLRNLLLEGGEVGKKLDFLLQETHRETNTILSKANGTGEPGRRVCDLALGVKSEIEKIREQSLNLE